jgi:hypothetical protein
LRFEEPRGPESVTLGRFGAADLGLVGGEAGVADFAVARALIAKTRAAVDERVSALAVELAAFAEPALPPVEPSWFDPAEPPVPVPLPKSESSEPQPQKVAPTASPALNQKLAFRMGPVLLK